MNKSFFCKTQTSTVKNRTAFTLIELIVSITILSVIMLAVFEIYSNILQINKRLEVMRTIQENVRNITEQIASDIREK
ncbi:prepilin-type N-terminal cleavage/methylation domain-containing protein [bacterium]|nr:prepilin-type N-terminal cleavage/methylation domain-containing protein [bacterium]